LPVAIRGPIRLVKLAAPLRGVSHRVIALGFIALSLALIFVGRGQPSPLDRVRIAIVDIFVPVLGAIAQPVEASRAVVDYVQRAINVHGENARLREEVARLQHWQVVARSLDSENASLRELLQVPSDPPLGFVTARVVANSGGTFLRSVLIIAGRNDGVGRGNAAITSEGLIGRVTEIGERGARVLLITDMNSNVPVVLERSRERAIAVGDNSDRLKLVFTASDAKPQIGDRVLTSGHGGVFPPGLPVGVVVAIGENGARVQPLADLARLDFVRVVDYGLGGVLPQSAPPPSRVPRGTR
jgi:rod shape-determining protein MreC